jgi:glycyl-tRNA synthetase alpha chain
VTERQSYILRVRDLARACCESWLATQMAKPAVSVSEGAA